MQQKNTKLIIVTLILVFSLYLFAFLLTKNGNLLQVGYKETPVSKEFQSYIVNNYGKEYWPFFLENKKIQTLIVNKQLAEAATEKNVLSRRNVNLNPAFDLDLSLDYLLVQNYTLAQKYADFALEKLAKSGGEGTVLIRNYIQLSEIYSDLYNKLPINKKPDPLKIEKCQKNLETLLFKSEKIPYFAMIRIHQTLAASGLAIGNYRLAKKYADINLKELANNKKSPNKINQDMFKRLSEIYAGLANLSDREQNIKLSKKSWQLSSEL
jgi:hypothetical protein